MQVAFLCCCFCCVALVFFIVITDMYRHMFMLISIYNTGKKEAVFSIQYEMSCSTCFPVMILEEDK